MTDPSDRTRLRRLPKRGHYDAETIYPILDEALISYIGFVQDGQPFVIPTQHARRGDEVLLHGASVGRLMRHLQSGEPICLTAVLVDGLVLAKTVFNHSMNYRSVMVFGRGRLIDEPAEKLEALKAFTEKFVPGRWEAIRQPTEAELKATAIIALEIEEASAKVRAAPPGDDPEDQAWPVWAGVLPLRTVALAPEPAAYSTGEVPEHVQALQRQYAQ